MTHRSRRVSIPALARAARVPLAALLCVMAAACGNGSLGDATQAQIQAIRAEAAAPPVLQSGEKISINVYNEPTLSGTFQVDPSGQVSLPLAGTVKATGYTQAQFEKVLAARFHTEVRDPRVTVSIVEFPPIYVVGEVEKPGAYPYTSGLNVTSAIALAGGTTYRADTSSILIQHPNDSGLYDYPMEPNLPVLPGDIIRIPQRYF